MSPEEKFTLLFAHLLHNGMGGEKAFDAAMVLSRKNEEDLTEEEKQLFEVVLSGYINTQRWRMELQNMKTYKMLEQGDREHDPFD